MTNRVDQWITDMDEAVALPRKNGELVFEAPWEARAFGLAVALNEQGLYPWTEFSGKLAETIEVAESPSEESGSESSLYYERWLATLEQTLLENALVTENELEAQIAIQVSHDAHHEVHHEHH